MVFMTEFDFVKIIGDSLGPLGVKLSIDNRSGVNYLVVNSSACVLKADDWRYFFSAPNGLGDLVKRQLHTHKITVHEISILSDTVVELNLGTVFDLLKDINHE